MYVCCYSTLELRLDEGEKDSEVGQDMNPRPKRILWRYDAMRCGRRETVTCYSIVIFFSLVCFVWYVLCIKHRLEVRRLD